VNLNRLIITILVPLLLGLQARLWFGEGSFAHLSGLGELVDQKIADNKRKQQRNEILKAEVLDLRNGLDAIEAKARSELGLIKKGETFFLVLDNKSG
jgi:cell division protein FtsB